MRGWKESLDWRISFRLRYSSRYLSMSSVCDKNGTLMIWPGIDNDLLLKQSKNENDYKKTETPNEK